MSQKMDPEVKEKWLEALRSGDYQQTGGALHFKGRFCCLGVLCDLHRKKIGNSKWDIESDLKKYLNEARHLPLEVMKWAGVKNCHVRISHEATLASLNDAGRSFNTIADIIEEKL